VKNGAICWGFGNGFAVFEPVVGQLKIYFLEIGFYFVFPFSKLGIWT
jgi:hypothetical protein